MKSVAPGHGTVAEQVAALPPLSQLLGLDIAESKGSPRPTGKSNRVNSKRAAAPLNVAKTPVERKEAKQEVLSLPCVTNAPPKKSVLSPSHSEKESTKAASPPPPSPQRYPGGLREWRHVQSTLQLPLVYRAEDNIKLTLRLLRSLPFFSSLLDNDLLTLAETMSVMEVAAAGSVLLRKEASLRPPPLPSPNNSSSPTAAAAAADLTPAAAARAPPPKLDSYDTEAGNDDRATAARPSWVMPAAELFQHFRGQMAEGDPPSLPPACLDAQTPKATTASSGAASLGSRPNAGKCSPNDTEALDQLKEPLFHVPEGWLDESEGVDGVEDSAEPFVIVLLSGHCELRWPRQRGPTEGSDTPDYCAYNVQPGDAMGYALIWSALPPGARYVTLDTCMLLHVSVEGHSHEIKDRLYRACRRANEVVYRAQKTYLAAKLLTPLFAADLPTEEEGGDDAASAATSTTAAVTVGNRSETDNRNASMRSSSVRSGILKPPTRTATLEVLLDLAARQLIPIRVPSETVLLREGLSPATECALYFVVEGSCAVVRRLWSQDQLRLEARKAQLVKELTPPNGLRPVLPTMPSTTSMEVAQLRPGDYCGDLAYLRVDPDHATSIDAAWTAAYWQSTFVPPSAAAAEEEEECGLASSRRAHRRNVESAGGAARAEKAETKSLFRRHKATVITQRSALLYVLLPTAAAEVVRGTVLERMKEHACACRSYTSMLTEHEKLFKWAIYKEKVLWEQSRKATTPLR
ncbi:hypothetical protein ABB37_00035 [Leptomonas pyrrhocoris]|uniref:Cyclic nucleotide-binding domain-containing protein n=1 Tax=Leptomonas pyrrhocoris TaxID=157538 RepID=A0A0N0DZS4_LEPPY|nr:hypothetical protein ABB37_00035 [Leptomonas pyrrhocoris]XP_015664072.1 hypothetical protein ABB37_00035 [Leptomonas pyrrhocoris]KPA85632.1 hypothetical protein ABB37_00035 [Leptomonas pyrrhocoris]KPA85633.1 hypothetical protein ABB37_00035 [Leptomonas pyrrhocoris]|eukprot:XP_015664071.1 hypothetical protein ABB37_00035 [Leptomonas pyrrhocoris]